MTQKVSTALDEIIICDLFNAVQDPRSRLFIDIRPKSEYRCAHVRHAVNLPITMSDDDIISIFRDCFFFDSVYCYGSASQIEGKKDVAFYNRLESVLENKLNEKKHKLYILNIGIERFIELFPFLCVNNDVIQDNKDIIEIYFKRQSKYESYPSQIIDGLYLGTIEHAENKHILQDLQITHIVNVTTRNYKDETVLNGRQMHQILVGDHQHANIAQYFHSVFKFIHDALHNDESENANENENDESKQNSNTKTGKDSVVFVHCKEGMSRGPTIVICYLMKSRCMTFLEALQFVKRRREVINPNNGFQRQLKEYEKNNYAFKPKQF